MHSDPTFVTDPLFWKKSNDILTPKSSTSKPYIFRNYLGIQRDYQKNLIPVFSLIGSGVFRSH